MGRVRAHGGLHASSLHQYFQHVQDQASIIPAFSGRARHLIRSDPNLLRAGESQHFTIMYMERIV